MLTLENNLVKNTYATVFGEEHPDLIKLFLAEGDVRTFGKGRSIFREGEDAEGFYWILNGYAKVCKCLQPGEEQIITLVGPGDFVGVSSCLVGGQYKKGCVVLGRSLQALYVSADVFLEWFTKHPSISLPLMRQIESKIDRIENRASYYMRKTIDQRLAHSLLLLAERFGLGTDKSLNIKLSPQEIASFIGTTRTTIYRILKRFEQDYALVVDQKNIRLINSDLLRAIAN
jgi:CRP-like cAMP-binding protein